MAIFFRRPPRLPAIIALAPLLWACSTGAPYQPADESRRSGIADELTPPVVVITPELVALQKQQRPRLQADDIRRLVAPPAPYLIGPGDILTIVVWGHPELARSITASPAPALPGAARAAQPAQPDGFAVDYEGLLQFPYAGAVKVAGLTPDQARDLLASRIAHYINNPKVTLRVQAFRSQRIYIDGEVKNPGVQSINDVPMTLVEALNRAGGATAEANQSQIQVVREGKSYSANILQLVQSGIDPAGIMLRNGDLVRVVSRQESKVFVVGEVSKPKALTMHNGTITLNEALGESGGISATGDARQVYIVRREDAGPTIFRLDAQSPGALALAEGFELRPKDLVYVAPTGLTNWYRTITQLIPGGLPDMRQATRK